MLKVTHPGHLSLLTPKHHVGLGLFGHHWYPPIMKIPNTSEGACLFSSAP